MMLDIWAALWAWGQENGWQVAVGLILGSIWLTITGVWGW